MNSETNVIEIGPIKNRTMRHHAVLLHRSKGIQQVDLPENLPETSDQEQILRELLDDSHKQIRLLEAQIKRMGSALIKAKLGEEE